MLPVISGGTDCVLNFSPFRFTIWQS